METATPKHKHRRAIALAAALVAIPGVLGCQSTAHGDNLAERALDSIGVHRVARPAFPATAAGLSPVRRRIVSVLRTEYDHPHAGEYYAQGVREPWCADFVSWTQRKAGSPVRNPGNGSWRIPGVATLTEYYQSVGRFRGPGYHPKPGDVVLYSPPNRFKQHTNTVIAVDGNRVTTLGGNEPPIAISINSYDLATVKGIVGYGLPR
ncbi:CHAP domain-containing protein [Gordonia sp. (in: high G+C Gram-positive bacteria)]|uniref:CHAP domain-containing protein n=1 Tax=Gordonia sp. (in: high G+C Gram-positive bacteria) TaxID=84139 RepID=UPI0039E29F39